MKIAVIHQAVSPAAGLDEQDVLTQVDCVLTGLAALGHEAVALPVTLNLEAAGRKLAELAPDLVCNLTESLAAKGNLIHLVPALLDSLKIPYTGARTEAMFLTSNKLLAKRWLAAAGLPTPPWLTTQEVRGELQGQEAWLVKSVWEHASIGLDEDSILPGAGREQLLAEMEARREMLGGACLAEVYIDGREFNLSLLAGEDGPELLPPAEIRFDAYPPGKVRVVGYRSKWEEGSFEFANTPRTFAFAEKDAPLLAHLKELALACWDLFDLAGYARVDFRVDHQGRPWILEVNANPCLSPDAGFFAAARQAGLTFPEVLDRIIDKTKRRNNLAPC
jgi:D-alanine-D-alanine ligase